MENKLLIASGNLGKICEIKAILSPLKLMVVSTQDLGFEIHVSETGNTYTENAHIKAIAYLQKSDLTVLADDSGLEVDLLSGAPGVYSARFSPKENANDADRRDYLIKQLKDKPQPWKAHFHCAAVLATPGGQIYETHGQCQGTIIPQERGCGGFGYDPIFYMPEFNATMAELPAQLKNVISHRAKALKAMIPMIIKVFSLGSK
ncbi:MAG: RdgB/HAM1 family non-canonical purine NTP pyrophosphatase [Anaerolineales bacterium]